MNVACAYARFVGNVKPSMKKPPYTALPGRKLSSQVKKTESYHEIWFTYAGQLYNA